MKRITLFTWAFIIAGAVSAQVNNWVNNGGTWEKDVTPIKYKFSKQTTAEVRANIFAVSGGGNPSPAITSTTGQDLSDGYMAMSGGQITGDAQTNTVRNGFEIVDGKLHFTLSNSIGGWQNLNFYVATKYTHQSSYMLKITWNMNLSTAKNSYIFSEDGQNDPVVLIPTGSYSYNYTQTPTSRKPFRFKVELGGASTAVFEDPVFLFTSSTKPTVRAITETVTGAGTISKQYSEVLDQDQQVFTFTPNSGQTLMSVKYNGTDVTSQVSENKFTTPLLKADAALEVAFTNNPSTGTKSLTESPVRLSVSDGQLHINGLISGDAVQIYSVSGKTIFKQNANASTVSINLPQGAYIIRVNHLTQKVVL